MPRIARIVGVGFPHHIIQRGNNRERVFTVSADYEKYLSFLLKYSEEKETAVLAYCLMPNHTHLLVKPEKEEALPKMMQGITLSYSKYFNGENGRTGRLWECRYYSSVIDADSYLWAVIKYIENNPVRAGIVQRPEDYSYSSAKAHILGKKDPLLKEPLFNISELNEYREFIRSEQEKKVVEEIRKQTRSGKPLGDPQFLITLSERLGSSLSFKPKGRPKKAT
ncbi:MAG: transposase [Deltaproteobacteria bacterium]|nr:transposase [Deltaproteobacteria bacterium]